MIKNGTFHVWLNRIEKDQWFNLYIEPQALSHQTLSLFCHSFSFHPFFHAPSLFVALFKHNKLFGNLFTYKSTFHSWRRIFSHPTVFLIRFFASKPFFSLLRGSKIIRCKAHQNMHIKQVFVHRFYAHQFASGHTGESKTWNKPPIIRKINTNYHVPDLHNRLIIFAGVPQSQIFCWTAMNGTVECHRETKHSFGQ